MICRRRKLIFIHIPKCGGSSVETVLWGRDEKSRRREDLWRGQIDTFHNKYQTGGLQHLTAQFIRQEVGTDLFDTCFKFAVVRHPLRRIRSQFAHTLRHKRFRDFLGLPDSFGYDQYLDHITTKAHVQWMPAADFLLDGDGTTLLVDKIFKLEQVSHNIRPFNRALGLTFEELPRVNVTPAAPVPKPTGEQIERIESLFARDYDLLGYRRRAENAGKRRDAAQPGLCG